MRTGLLIGLIVAVLAGSVLGQPKDGDLVLAVSHSPWSSLSWIAYLDPARPATLTTLGMTPPGYESWWIRMASDNVDLVVNENPVLSSLSPSIIRITPNGVRSTLAPGPFPSLPGVPQAFELDHDGQWIATGNASYNGWRLQTVFGFATSSTIGVTNVFAHLVDPVLATLYGPVIDRDPGAPTYCVSQCRSGFSWIDARLLGVDRQNNVTTLLSLPSSLDLYSSTSIQLHPRTGDYITIAFDVYSLPPPQPICLAITKTGRITTLAYGGLVGRVVGRVTQDDCLWLTDGGNNRLTKFHIPSMKVVSTIPLYPNPPPYGTVGLEVYGYRRVVCTQSSSSPTTVTVNVQSRHPLAAGASYILAASPARRPGTRFSNGEWLDLDVTDPLFLTSALGWAPGIFQNFQGTLDANGNATAKVVLPPGLPKMNDMAIFVAGVIYNGSNIIQVTNSHWFVLN